jgi:Flp pilus assembly protein TadD
MQVTFTNRSLAAFGARDDAGVLHVVPFQGSVTITPDADTLRRMQIEVQYRNGELEEAVLTSSDAVTPTDRDSIIAKLDAAGIEYDGRWGVARLQALLPVEG